MESVFGLEKINTVQCTRVIIDFLRYVFGNLTPVQYRYEEDVTKTRVVIGGHEVFGLENAGGIIKISVVRSSFSIEHRTINQAGPVGSTYAAKRYADLMDGTLSIVVEAGTSEEATGLATWAGMVVNANRHIIIKEAPGVFHALKLRQIAEERTVDMQAKPIRIQCAAVFEAPLNMSWIEDKKKGFVFSNIEIRHADQPPVFVSHCNYTASSKILIDLNARFGYFNTNNPKFVEGDLAKGWYSIIFTDTGSQNKIVSVISPTELELENDIGAAMTDVPYQIAYNSMYFDVLAQKL
jgi:hypothetical protein